MLHTREIFPMRYWIVDNSGSMGANDGNIQTPRGPVQSTRWAELRETVQFHATLADAMGAPTEFRLLNPAAGAQQITTVGTGNPAALQTVLRAMKTDPGGRTPLCGHLNYVYQQIASRAAALNAAGQKAVLVIASDGCATDGDLQTTVKQFENLPVWVVVRLCTDEEQIVEYWNNIDGDVEVDMDVLDDVAGEAAEVYAVNPWINYCMPIHRCREWGLHRKVFDLLDERKLTSGEMRDFMELVFREPNLPYAEQNWKAFEARVVAASQREKMSWDCNRGKFKHIVSPSRLRRCYAGGQCSIM